MRLKQECTALHSHKHTSLLCPARLSALSFTLTAAHTCRLGRQQQVHVPAKLPGHALICGMMLWQGQDGLPQIMSTRRIGTGSRPLQAHNAGATETLVINPRAGLQARHVSYAVGVTASNITFHSNSSGKGFSVIVPAVGNMPSADSAPA